MGGIGFHGNRIGTTRVGWVLEGGNGDGWDGAGKGKRVGSVC